ncbi:MAG TPA: hypothetical protein VMV89_03590 [Candidatus Paceibacterota bacterium]|nr:hypothetical protein [Candidatus Paceibacterota bacterium]
MKPEDFEQKLQRQPLRQVPGEWRAEILAVAEHASRPKPRASFLSTLNQQLSTLLWPHPKAWAGLAAVWILIFAVDFSTRDKSPVMAEKVSPPSPEMIAELKKEHLMYAELMGLNQTREAGPAKFSPRPRTERVEILTA